MRYFFITLTLPLVIQTELIQRHTRFGDVIGLTYTTNSGNTAEKYLGLPYARAPVDHLRFEYPVPLLSFPIVPYNATFRRPWCLQDGRRDFSPVGKEDCLYLNIFRPHVVTKKEKYPVLFWIHGGSYRSWSGNVFDVDGAIDNFASKGVVLVTINFRLGALGFMSLLNNSLPGNYGLEDQLLALKWVNNNIEDYDGDPNSITLCGESSGAASVNLLAFSPKSRGLFHRIIMISGAALTPWAIAPQATKHFTKEIIDRIECKRNDVLECLRTRDFFWLSFEGQLALHRDSRLNRADPFSEKNYSTADGCPENCDQTSSITYETPVIYCSWRFMDIGYISSYRGREAILPLPLRELMSESKLQVPVLLGFSKGEIPKPGRPQTEKFEQLLPLGRLKNKKEAVKIIKERYCGNFSEEICSDLYRKINNDYSIHAPMCLTAKLFEKRGAPTFVYSYDLTDGSDEPAEHISDVAFLFNDTSLIINNEYPPDLPIPSTKIKSFIFNSFLQFIKTGNPNGGDNANSIGLWPRYSSGEPTVVRIQNEVIERMGCYENETSFWRTLDMEFSNI